MSDPMLTLGFAVIGFLVPYALFEIYDAVKYRDHPTEDPIAEVKAWSIVVGVWVLAVGWVAFG